MTSLNLVCDTCELEFESEALRNVHMLKHSGTDYGGEGEGEVCIGVREHVLKFQKGFILSINAF